MTPQERAIQPSLGLDSLPAVPHQADFAAHTITDVADRAIAQGATALAATAIDAAVLPGLRERLLAKAFSSVAAAEAVR
jgi:hypothetical protein